MLGGIEVEVYGFSTVNSLVSSLIIFFNESIYSLIKLQAVACRIQINMFLFDGAEPSFYKCIIGSTPLTIHTDTYLIIIKGIYPMAAGILAALIGVHNLRDSMHGNGLFQ